MKIILMPTREGEGRFFTSHAAPTVEISVPSNDLNLDEALELLVKPVLLAYGYPSESVEDAMLRALGGDDNTEKQPQVD